MPIIDKHQSELIELTKRCRVIWEGMQHHALGIKRTSNNK